MKSLLKEIVLSLIVPLSELIWTTVSLGGQSTAAGGGEPRGSGPAGGGGLPRGHAAGEDPERPGWHSTVTATHPQRSPESAVTSWDLTPDPWPWTVCSRTAHLKHLSWTGSRVRYTMEWKWCEWRLIDDLVSLSLKHQTGEVWCLQFIFLFIFFLHHLTFKTCLAWNKHCVLLC